MKSSSLFIMEQYAALHARPEACRLLIEHGADANVRTSWHGKFGDVEAAYGKGFYSSDSQLTGEQFNRGWPAYSYAIPAFFLQII